MESGNKKTEWENSLEKNAKNYATECHRKVWRYTNAKYEKSCFMK